MVLLFVDSGASLIAGIIFGVVLAIGAFLVSRDPNNWYLILATNVVLAGFMGYRAYVGGKFMPAGLITILR